MAIGFLPPETLGVIFRTRYDPSGESFINFSNVARQKPLWLVFAVRLLNSTQNNKVQYERYDALDQSKIDISQVLFMKKNTNKTVDNSNKTVQDAQSAVHGARER